MRFCTALPTPAGCLEVFLPVYLLLVSDFERPVTPREGPPQVTMREPAPRTPIQSGNREEDLVGSGELEERQLRVRSASSSFREPHLRLTLKTHTGWLTTSL